MGYKAGEFGCIVVGAGHAGVEAALAAARMGVETLLLTISLDTIAFMPCNPSIGGPAKGHVVREIDALGGEMGRNIDKTYLQMRMLNTGKGPAVHALRAQADKFEYQKEMKKTLETTPHLTLKQTMVEKLIIEDQVVKGVITRTGAEYYSQTVVLTTGTYLRGRIILGDLIYESGPNNQQPSVKLSEHLREIGFELVRFKTGTPPRVDRDSIDFSKMEIQPGDEEPRAFSFDTTEYRLDQIPCWLTYTNFLTHSIINNNLHRAPMFSGVIEGTGPRYCPSIEDKVVRFNDKPRHQIFLEPEGEHTNEMYVQGLSTSLPEEVQIDMLRTIPGLENAEIMRAGYAIEYDVIVPTQLWPTLETKKIKNLFTAGQLNGTSGYEEAAGQGLMAGINAACRVLGKDPVVLDRSQAYIGVLIDDLVTKGTNEPYRLLTSRAEYRLLLRHDNADLRLREIGYQLGLIDDERYQRFLDKKEKIEQEINRLKTEKIRPSEEVQVMMKEVGTSELNNAVELATLLRRPEITYEIIEKLSPSPVELSAEMKEQVEIQIKYSGYIEKQLLLVEKMKKVEAKKIPEWLDYNKISGLSMEAREKLNKIQPMNIGQASRISGVSPADISILLVYIEQGK
ncbi:tRNA uridine-5-carboxymethylaminomethyl(34) synthesis enzyme MnmG [Tepidibacillus decaturensis]|uniref:tRNA uridine 5-carboxymethylaminomethyl modification enzyme MnmG n=1 Tax=Tepidibacillus decaturensis TaxID=1413211 RepID=A0A135L7A0_9BACI|nr:tRNA uridine-5-carboxymethylaminomethyl(34) synthesis enzyme MnmG [Tepidibacillus decaturensis]KXG44787.1 tRNA uridine 5-carboxymethylaminomethyl modification protein [Tepidibacillus decaturensis]